MSFEGLAQSAVRSSPRSARLAAIRLTSEGQGAVAGWPLRPASKVTYEYVCRRRRVYVTGCLLGHHCAAATLYRFLPAPDVRVLGYPFLVGDWEMLSCAETRIAHPNSFSYQSRFYGALLEAVLCWWCYR